MLFPLASGKSFKREVRLQFRPLKLQLQSDLLS
jgi:hypothetical protein